MSNLRGSKGFEINLGNSENGPWTLIASGTFQNPIPAGKNGDVVEKTVIRLKEEVTGRYVQFKCTSWYKSACALQYIGVIQGSILLQPSELLVT